MCFVSEGQSELIIFLNKLFSQWKIHLFLLIEVAVTGSVITSGQKPNYE